MGQGGVRSKIRTARAPGPAVRGTEAAWSLAFGRASRDTASLDLAVEAARLERRGLAELLELPPERGLIAVLDGPKEGLGLIVLGPDLLAGIVEMQTIGRVSAGPALVRRPTRTDAAMAGDLIDRALILLEEALAAEEDLVWAGGFRYASFLEDARPLGHLLEDQPYRVMVAEAVLSGGAKRDRIILALPAEGRGPAPARLRVDEEAKAGAAFRAALGAQVMASAASMHAVLARVTLPIQAVMALQAGDTLRLGRAALDRIDVETSEGRRTVGGKLGQNRGMRAVRVLADAEPAERVSPRAVGPAAKVHAVRAAG